ncbi:MAG TPA: hypothetical protein PLX58_08370 [Smithellaceae bacterium]|nr:hypothetical protein [Smithellaceae bacterium]HQF84973.1 hypothetical protein [Smithellaceae bacterium]HQG81201.1 hypothetical protein [Smithellaceae bacterium]
MRAGIGGFGFGQNEMAAQILGLSSSTCVDGTADRYDAQAALI